MSYDPVLNHADMLYDARRNALYEAALRPLVKPDSAVLDLGAGLGPHGFLAAQLGARKVYLVDSAKVIRTTREMAERAGVTNVECIEGDITRVELPEPVDLIVSVFTGNFLVSEDLLPALFSARRRFLKPGGLMVPGQAAMMVAPVSAPGFYQQHIDLWREPVFGISYVRIRDHAINNVYTVTAAELAPQLLSAPGTLRTLDFLTADNADCDHEVSTTILEAGTCHGLVGWFTADLAGVELCTAPTSPPMHWRQVFLPLPEPVPVAPGDTLTVHLTRPDHGEWTWRTRINEKSFTQSSFLAGPNYPDELRRRSPGYAPAINRRGEAMAMVLARMDGQLTSGELSAFLLAEFADVFPSPRDALEFAQAVADRYG